jgi:hypothetical protein
MSKIKYGLLIGLNYKQTSFPLAGCWNDVDEMDKYLSSQNYINIVMKDSDSVSSVFYPNMENIIKQFQFILSKSPSNIFLYYSGHGGQTFDFDKDELDKKDECIWIYDKNNKVVAFTDDKMKQVFIDNLDTKTFLVSVFDSCHSESILDLDLRYKFIKNKPYFDVITKKRTNKNVISISGCQDHDYSGETFIDGKVRGILTYFLLYTITKTKTLLPIENIYRSSCQHIKSSNLSLQIPQFCLSKPILRTYNLI